MTTTQATYPHPEFPVMPLERSLEIFERAKVPQQVVADLLCTSRMQVYRWRVGQHHTANPLAVQRASSIAWRVKRALTLGREPHRSDDALPMDAWTDALDDANYSPAWAKTPTKK